MVTINTYPGVSDGEGLADVANRALANDRRHGATVLRTASAPRTAVIVSHRIYGPKAGDAMADRQKLGWEQPMVSLPPDFRLHDADADGVPGGQGEKEGWQ